MLERTRPTTRGTGASNAPQEEAKMNKCNEKCEVYSRVTGYFRPVANWNKGKKEEFADMSGQDDSAISTIWMECDSL